MPRRLRIAIFINDMNSLGGIQRVAAQMCRDLARSHDVFVLTLFEADKQAFSKFEGPTQTLGYEYWPSRFYPRLRELPGMARRLRRFVREHEVDVVIAFWFHLACLAAVALPRSVAKIGFEHISFSAAGGHWRRIRAWSYPRLDAVVSLTEEDAANYAKISRRVVVIPNYVAVPPTPPEARAQQPILLAVGHVEYRKGIDRLLWALKEPLLANPDWRLVMVGGGGTNEEHWYVQYLASLIALLQLRDRVEFHPATPAIDAWYRQASIYVMGSRMEGFPMVLLEAKAHGLPTVTYDCRTGPKEIVRDEVDGFVVSGESAVFGAAALRLMQDPDLRRRMGEAARADAGARFSHDAVMARWGELIETLGREKAR